MSLFFCGLSWSKNTLFLGPGFPVFTYFLGQPLSHLKEQKSCMLSHDSITDNIVTQRAHSQICAAPTTQPMKKTHRVHDRSLSVVSWCRMTQNIWFLFNCMGAAKPPLQAGPTQSTNGEGEKERDATDRLRSFIKEQRGWGLEKRGHTLLRGCCLYLFFLPACRRDNFRTRCLTHLCVSMPYPDHIKTSMYVIK